jgi:hypothetical protein
MDEFRAVGVWIGPGVRQLRQVAGQGRVLAQLDQVMVSGQSGNRGRRP